MSSFHFSVSSGIRLLLLASSPGGLDAGAAGGEGGRGWQGGRGGDKIKEEWL